MGINRVKNFLIGGLFCLVVALVVGFEPVQRTINEATNKGTLKGVETCMSYSDSELLSSEAVKATCVAAFQKRLYHNDHAIGRAGPLTKNGVVNWGGVLENKTPDHVTTWLRISVVIHDDEGAELEYFAATQIWIDPLEETEFEVELTDLDPAKLDGLEFCENDNATPTDCMTWGITDLFGLSI